MRNLLVNPQQIALLQQSQLGVEVEEHRIDQKGHLSQSAHPAALGDRRSQPYFQSDFAESQAELITDPHRSITALSRQLATLQMILTRALQPGELIWPLSLPPTVNTTELAFIAQHFERPTYQNYRDYLLEKYGIQHEITTGSHVSFSLPATLLAGQTIMARNELYFHIVQNFMLSRWLLTYLFGASPQAAPNYFTTTPTALLHPVRSVRNSEYGFTNAASEQVAYTSLTTYLNGISAGIRSGELYSPHEFYGPVRLKGQEDLSALSDQGITYLEFRIFDLDPFSSNALSSTTLRFFKVFLSYLAVRPLPTDLATALATAHQRNRITALEVPQAHSVFATAMAAWLQPLQTFSQSWPLSYRQAVAAVLQRVTRPELTPSAQIMKSAATTSMTAFALKQAAAHHQQRSRALLPEATGMTIEQQDLLIAAYQRGLHIKHQGTQLLIYDRQREVTLQQIILNGLSATTRLAQLFPVVTRRSS
ncbi:gamma-glutamylcysteine synthetase [Loigolactobacillus binensis]|uniref:Glutamate--cysteine ligase n=1 Tax=Loigolactobacillus binensis TaxID=2559922 RepID=A0ABW3EAX0_9LACO|nr:gamma-glutamylcysteine synthetase [Loigolactobacillus binensis]